MRRMVIGFAALGGLIAAAGCQYTYATPAVQGRTFVVKNSFTGGTFWNCDATSGEPVCYEVNKVNLPAGTNK